jgi:IS5 family transposase
LADLLAVRRFVGITLDEYTPDHSTIPRTRRLIDLDTHGETRSLCRRDISALPRYSTGT